MLLHFSMLVLIFFTNVLDFFIIRACFDIQAANIIGIFCISTTYAFENFSIPVVLVEAAAYRAGLSNTVKVSGEMEPMYWFTLAFISWSSIS